MILGAINLGSSPFTGIPVAAHAEFIFMMVAAASLVGAITDVVTGKIKNWLTFPLFGLGLLAALVLGGWDSFAQAIGAALLVLIVFGTLFAFGILGAGDVKLVMALATWGGVYFTQSVLILSLGVGAGLGLVQLAIKGRLIGFGQRMYRFVLTLMVKDFAVEKPKIDKKLTFPFGVCIAIASIWTFLENPLKKWGIL